MPIGQPAQAKPSKRLDTLTRSFVAVLSSYQLAQFAVFAAYALPLGFFGAFALPFAISSVGFHLLTLALLVVFRNDFVIEPSGRRLERVNLANGITLFRISTLPTVLFVILASRDYPVRYALVALVAIVFATDFLDGFVSRRYEETTRVGRMMDSASDYSLLFVISLVFYYFRIIPAWFLYLLVGRLAGQTLMVLAVLAVKKRVTPRTSFLGKATVASTMALYAFELLRFVADLPPAAYSTLEYVVGGIVAVSIFDKLRIMLRDLRAAPIAAAGPGRLTPTNDGETHGDDQERARDSDGTDQGPEGGPQGPGGGRG